MTNDNIYPEHERMRVGQDQMVYEYCIKIGRMIETIRIINELVIYDEPPSYIQKLVDSVQSIAQELHRDHPNATEIILRELDATSSKKI